MSIFVVFFFQAEDGIRDADVTGVQTCALPISLCLCGTFYLFWYKTQNNRTYFWTWQKHARRNCSHHFHCGIMLNPNSQGPVSVVSGYSGNSLPDFLLD